MEEKENNETVVSSQALKIDETKEMKEEDAKKETETKKFTTSSMMKDLNQSEKSEIEKLFEKLRFEKLVKLSGN